MTAKMSSKRSRRTRRKTHFSKIDIDNDFPSHRYCVFFIKDEKFITVEKLGGRDASYEEFLTDLQAAGEGECRYGLYDFEYEHQCQVRVGWELDRLIVNLSTQGTTESSKKQKLFLMSWCPDSAKIKKKMLYASSFETLKKSLVS